MKKTNIYAIIGKAGSGKDYILKKVLRNINANGIISCTTRPPREGEVDGKDYHFVPKEYFLNHLNDFLEYQEFRGWLYGTRYEDLSEDKINIGVFNLDGISDLLSSEMADKLKVIYLVADDKTRLIRQLQREENPDIEEIFRRYKTDEEDFHYVQQLLDNINPENRFCVDNSQNGIETVYEIVQFIKEAEKRECIKNEN